MKAPRLTRKEYNAIAAVTDDLDYLIYEAKYNDHNKRRARALEQRQEVLNQLLYRCALNQLKPS